MIKIIEILKKFLNNKQAIKELGLFTFLKLKNDKKFLSRKVPFRKKTLMTVDSSTFITLVNEIFGDEVYKFDSLGKDLVIFDCGSNIGLAALYFKFKYPDSTVICFEPDPRIFKALEFNIRSFKLSKVILNNTAISTKFGEVVFKSDGGLSGMVSNVSDGTISVPSTRLKSELEKFKKIDFLKIDIEGHEDEVIFDIADQLVKVEYLFLEYHSFLQKDQILGQILNLLKKSGFRYYIKESEQKKYPFISREIFMNMDTVVNIFCYRN